MADADHGLVSDLKQRQARAWAQLYDRHAGDVFSFIAHLLHGDRAAAEELHQETWLAALAGIAGFDAARGELRGWIFGIARRQVALHFRRLGQGRPESAPLDAEIADAHDGRELLPLDVIGRVEQADAVRAALAELGSDARAVLLGKYVDGHSVDELARRLGRSAKAVESQLSRARARLRALLARYFDTEQAWKD